MRIKDCLTKPVTVDVECMEWTASPTAEVDRCMLYRRGRRWRVGKRSSCWRAASFAIRPAPRTVRNCQMAASSSCASDNSVPEIRAGSSASRTAARITVPNVRALEFLVTSGGINVAGYGLGPQGWGHFPAGEGLLTDVEPESSEIWLKDAALQYTSLLPLRK